MSSLSNLLRRETFFVTAVLLIAGAAVLPLWEDGGLLNTRGGGDSPFLLQRVHQMVVALQDGHFPVRWMPDANYGYGYPFYNFYAPLSIYIAAAFRLIGFTFTRSIQLAQLLGFLVAGWGVYKLGCCWGWRHWQALLASVAYTTAPFHLVNVYVRGDSLAEFWAMAFYPLLLWSAERLLRSERISAETTLPLAFSYAALLLSHNISALIFTPFLGVYILARALPQPQRIRLLGNALLAGILGLALSAWFWLPALAEQTLVQLAPVTEGYFHYSGHFLDEQLIQRTWQFNYDVTAQQNPFRMGWVQALLIGAAALALGWQTGRQRFSSQGSDTDDRIPIFLFCAVVLATFMLLSASNWLWEHVPLLEFTQFPWRFLSVQALFGALLIGAALPKLPRWEPLLVIGLSSLLLWSAFGALQADFLRVEDADISAESIAQYEWFTGNIGTTISAEYLPHTVQPRPWSSDWPNRANRHAAQVMDGQASVRPIHLQTQRQQWQIDVETAFATIRIPLLFFDGWTATNLSDGKPLELVAAAGSGLAQVSLPAGRHLIELTLQRTTARLWAESISLVVFLLCVGVGWGQLWQRKRIWLIVSVALLILGGLLRMAPNSAEPPTLQSWDFAQIAYLNRAEAIAFSDGSRLLAADYSQDVIQAGETVTIVTRWSPNSTGDVVLTLTTPAKHREIADRQVPPIAMQVRSIEAGMATFELTIPANAPTGLIVPRLSRANVNALTEAGFARGPLFLKPLRVESPIVIEAADTLQAEIMAVTRAESSDLLVKARWLTPQPLSENYQATWRVYDRFGRFYAEIDTQPGFGYLPTSNWPANQWVNDWVQLAWRADDGVEPYTIVAALHRPSDGMSIYQDEVARFQFTNDDVELLPIEPNETLPAQAMQTDINFDEKIQLRGYILEQSPSEVVVTLYWEALRHGLPAYRHFVHFVNQETGEVVTQHDTEPQFGTRPTDRWQSAELIPDLAVLYLDNIPSGKYEIHVGLYQNLGDQFPRLIPFDVDGEALPDLKVILPDVLLIP